MIKVGERLKEERKKKGLTLEQVAKATKIRPEFLRAIEAGTYEKLPGSNYAYGFVKNYLELVELPVAEYLARFRREYDADKQRKLMPEGLVGKENIPLKRFSVQHAILLGIGILGALFLYLLFQYRAAFWSPRLTVDVPKENAVTTAQTVLIKGTTDPNAGVTINTLPAYVDTNGNFSKEIPVFPGTITLTIKAVNSFGKIATVVRHITVKTSQ